MEIEVHSPRKMTQRRLTISLLLLMLFLAALPLNLVPPSSAENRLQTLGPYFNIRLDVEQIKKSDSNPQSGLITNIDVTILNTDHPTNVTILSTYVSDPSVNLNESISISVSIGVTEPIQFSSWSYESGHLTSSQLDRLIIQSINSTFPNEVINFNLFVGSNYSLKGDPFVFSPPTYVILHEGSVELPSNYTSTVRTPPALLSDLFTTYQHVYRVDLSLGHSSDFRSLVGFLGVAPYFVALTAGLLFSSIVIRLKVRRGPNVGDSITALITVLLFQPLFVIGITQTVPATAGSFAQDWLAQEGNIASWVLFVMVGLTLAAITLAWFEMEKDDEKVHLNPSTG